MERRGKKNYRRGCIPACSVHRRRYFFSFPLPRLLLLASPLFLSLFSAATSCSYNPQITNLTSERLKDQALFEVDSKKVIPGRRTWQESAAKNRRKNDEILFSPVRREESSSSSFLPPRGAVCPLWPSRVSFFCMCVQRDVALEIFPVYQIACVHSIF